MRTTTNEVAPARAHWLIERRVRVYPFLFLGMYVLAIPVYAMTFDSGVDNRGQAIGGDFITFWAAAQAMVQGHPMEAWNLTAHASVQLEAYPALAGPVTWSYPPPSLLFVAPLGFFPHPVAFLVWTVTGLTAFLVSLRPIIRGRSGAWPLALAFPGLWVGITNGQIQFFVGALLGGALLLLPRRPTLAGVLIGLLVIKPHLAILLPVALVAGRNWRTAAVAGVIAVVSLSVSMALIGSGSLQAWLDGMRFIGAIVETGAVPMEKMVTPFALLQQLGVPAGAALTAQALVAVVTAAVVYRIWRETEDVSIRGSAVILGTFLATPYAMDYDLAILAFPVAWLAILGADRGWTFGDRDLLVAAWVLPAVVAPITAATHVVVAPFVVTALLTQVWFRAKRATADAVVATGPRLNNEH